MVQEVIISQTNYVYIWQGQIKLQFFIDGLAWLDFDLYYT